MVPLKILLWNRDHVNLRLFIVIVLCFLITFDATICSDEITFSKYNLTENVAADVTSINNLAYKPTLTLDPKIRKALLNVLNRLEMREQQYLSTSDASTTITTTPTTTTANKISTQSPTHAINLGPETDTESLFYYRVSYPQSNDNLKGQQLASARYPNTDEPGALFFQLPSLGASQSEQPTTERESLSLEESKNTAQPVSVLSAFSSLRNRTEEPNLGPVRKVLQSNDTLVGTADKISPEKDIEFFRAPLLTAFTLEQDARGLPKRIIPLGEASALQTVLNGIPTAIIKEDSASEKDLNAANVKTIFEKYQELETTLSSSGVGRHNFQFMRTELPEARGTLSPQTEMQTSSIPFLGRPDIQLQHPRERQTSFLTNIVHRGGMPQQASQLHTSIPFTERQSQRNEQKISASFTVEQRPGTHNQPLTNERSHIQSQEPAAGNRGTSQQVDDIQAGHRGNRWPVNKQPFSFNRAEFPAQLFASGQDDGTPSNLNTPQVIVSLNWQPRPVGWTSDSNSSPQQLAKNKLEPQKEQFNFISEREKFLQQQRVEDRKFYLQSLKQNQIDVSGSSTSSMTSTNNPVRSEFSFEKSVEPSSASPVFPLISSYQLQGRLINNPVDGYSFQNQYITTNKGLPGPVDRQLQYLFQNLAANNQRGQEDFSIISKVLALNHENVEN